MTASDGDLAAMGDGVPHPRNYATFPRKIRRYVYDEAVVSLEGAIRGMTGLPADVFGLSDRGVIAEGMVADIVVFDPESLRDVATFVEPHQLSEGVRWLLVGGCLAIDDGSITGTRCGRVLAR